MSVRFEIHDNLADQPSEILNELLETPRLCLSMKANNASQSSAASISVQKTKPSNRKFTICGTNSLKKRKNKCQMQLTISH